MSNASVSNEGPSSILRLSKLFSTEMPMDEKFFWLLRVAVALCFVGHGSFAFITENGNMGKVGWLAFYKPFGLEPELVYKFMLMPLVGVLDYLVAFAVLFVPMRCVWAWATFWCVFTAFLRPLSGQGISEFFERGGNYGPPLALIVYSGLHFHSFKDWFSLVESPKITQKNIAQLMLVLRLAIAFLLIGHGGFFIFNENNQMDYLFQHWAAVGIDLTTVSMLAMGWFEVALGVLVFFKPLRHQIVAQNGFAGGWGCCSSITCTTTIHSLTSV